MAMAQSALPMMGDGAEMTEAAPSAGWVTASSAKLYRDPDYIDDAVLQEYGRGSCSAPWCKPPGAWQPAGLSRYAWMPRQGGQ